jgi:hypothetical protein
VPQAAIDRSISDASLPVGGFISGKDKEFGLLERAILRLGTFPRRTHKPAFQDTKLQVVIYPVRRPSGSYIQKMKNFIEQGGNLLVVDGADNSESTANDLLKPFGIQVNHDRDLPKTQFQTEDGATIEMEKGITVSGGTPLLKLDDQAVVSQITVGKGKVLVVGIGYRFADTNMGSSSDVIPDEKLKPVYALLHSLLRRVLE